MPDSEITQLLRAAGSGEPVHMEQLFAAVYERLKLLARKHLRDERPDHTLGATALVHEAFLKLVDQRDLHWESKAHFYGVASQAMRRILVDHARRRSADKRGRKHQVTLDSQVEESVHRSSEDILGVDEALGRLALLNPRQARVVEFRYFVGLSIEETAEVLGASTATVKRDWMVARAWLERELSPPQ